MFGCPEETAPSERLWLPSSILNGGSRNSCRERTTVFLGNGFVRVRVLVPQTRKAFENWLLSRFLIGFARPKIEAFFVASASPRLARHHARNWVCSRFFNDSRVGAFVNRIEKEHDVALSSTFNKLQRVGVRKRSTRKMRLATKDCIGYSEAADWDASARVNRPKAQTQNLRRSRIRRRLVGVEAARCRQRSPSRADLDHIERIFHRIDFEVKPAQLIGLNDLVQRSGGEIDLRKPVCAKGTFQTAQGDKQAPKDRFRHLAQRCSIYSRDLCVFFGRSIQPSHIGIVIERCRAV